jgi:hypothetical protein
MNDPDESRSIRPSGRSPHLLRWRLTTRTPRAVLHARFYGFGPSACSMRRVGFSPWPGPGGRGTPRRSTASVIRAASRARDLHAVILVEPPRSPNLGAPGIRSTPPYGGAALSSHERLWTFRSFAGGAVFDVAFRPPRIAWAAGRRPVHAAPFVVVQGACRMRRHPTNQRHYPVRPKDLE